MRVDPDGRHHGHERRQRRDHLAARHPFHLGRQPGNQEIRVVELFERDVHEALIDGAAQLLLDKRGQVRDAPVTVGQLPDRRRRAIQAMRDVPLLVIEDELISDLLLSNRSPRACGSISSPFAHIARAYLRA